MKICRNEQKRTKKGIIRMKKSVIFLLALLLTLYIFTGCTASDTDDTTVDKPTETALVTSEDAVPTESTEERAMEGNMYLEGFPIVEEKVTIDVGITQYSSNGDFNEIGVFPLLEELTNVDLNFVFIPSSGAEEKVSLMLATGDYPEAFIRIGMLRDSVETWKYAQAGVFVALDEYIEAYCPNIQKTFEDYPLAVQYSTAPDGHIYSLPSIRDSGIRDIRGVLYVNKIWLNELDMELPTTTGEYYNTLVAFKENDCNGNGDSEDEIPSTFLFDDGTAGYGDLFGSFGVYNAVDNKLSVINGEVVYEPVRDEYKEALKYMHQLYESGCIDSETFTQDSSVYDSKYTNADDEIILGSFIGYQSYDVLDPEIAMETYEAIAPLIGPDGTQYWRRDPKGVVDAHLFHVTDKCEDPEVLMRVIDALNSEEWCVMAQSGMEDINYQVTDDGQYKFLDVDPDDPEVSRDYFTNWKGPWMLTYDMYSKFIVSDLELDRKKCTDLYAPYVEKVENIFSPFVFVSTQDNEDLSIIQSDLASFQNRMEAQFIMEGNIEENWNEYVSEIESIGLAQLLEILQKAID